ncbi:MAG: SRPBCC family protein [Chloroflexota bacterium]
MSETLPERLKLMSQAETGFHICAQPYTDAPLRIAQTCHIGAPSDTLFWYITDTSHMCEFMPGITQATMEPSTTNSEAGLGRVRYCDFGRGLVVKETITLWEPPFYYGYQVDTPNPFGVHNHFSLVVCEPAQNDSCLSWYHFYDHADLTAMNKVMQEAMAGLMTNLIEQFKVTSINKPTSKNKQPK